MNTSDSSPVLQPSQYSEREYSSLQYSGLQKVHPPLILASGSAIRLALLQGAGLSVDVRPASIDEDHAKRTSRAAGHGPDSTALLLASLKAASIGEALVGEADAVVIGADQLLVCDGMWFDKPADLAAARDHLVALRGRAHVLHTAVSLHRGGRIIWQHVSRPRLTMRAFSDQMLDAYLVLEAGKILSSVGAYRLEGPGLQLFAEVEGEHAAILGLPMLALLDFLRGQGLLLQ